MKIRKIKFSINVLFMCLLAIGACEKSSEDILPDVEKQSEETTVEYNWQEIAEQAQESLIHEYWNSSQDYINQDNGDHIGFNYWWNAHGLDVLVDGYIRSEDPKYLTRMAKLLEGVRKRNGGGMWNTFYDDMEWMALACLRAYSVSGDELYKETARELWGYIKVGWSDINHGGIAWASGSPNSKNACSNAPAAILAARLYQLDGILEDLEWAKRIYQWQKKYLVDPSRGVVWDGYGNYNEANIYTYNQGTYIGASLELYKVTGEEEYLKEAIRTANYVINDKDKFSPSGILKGENSGDGGLFKGIFIRYLAQLTSNPDLEEFTRETYLRYIDKNAKSLWSKATLKPETLFGHTWTSLPSSSIIDSSIHLSAVMMLEARSYLSNWYQ